MDKLAVARVLGWQDDFAGLIRVEARPEPGGAPRLFVDGRPAARGVSLTDRAGCAVCLVAARTATVGCDVEIVEPRSDAFVRDYLTEAERRFAVAAGPGRDKAANLIWSAKESALKVLRTGLRRDTRSVEVTLAELDPPERTWSPLQLRSGEGAVFPGWWRQSGAFLVTACWPGGGPPPAALETGIPARHDAAIAPLGWPADYLAAGRLSPGPAGGAVGEAAVEAASRRSSTRIMNGRSSAGEMM